MKDIPTIEGTCKVCKSPHQTITKEEGFCIRCWLAALAGRLALEKHEDDGEWILEAIAEDCTGSVD